MELTIGLDIGGTKIAGGLVDAGGQLRATGRRDTPAHSPGAIAAEAADLIRELAAEVTHQQVVPVGVACAGFVDATGSQELFAANLAWRDEPLKARLEAIVEQPVLIENDARRCRPRAGGGGRMTQLDWSCPSSLRAPLLRRSCLRGVGG